MCKINLVLRENNEKIANGKELIRCAIKKSGFCLLINFNRGIKEKRKINIYENLLFKNPDLFQRLINLKYFKLCITTLSSLESLI